MLVKVKLFAFFREGRFLEKDMEFADGATAGDVVDRLDIDRDEVGVMMINSRHCEFGAVLKDGDTLAVFPVVGGG